MRYFAFVGLAFFSGLAAGPAGAQDPFREIHDRIGAALDHAAAAASAAEPALQPAPAPKPVAAADPPWLKRLEHLRPQVEPLLASQGLPASLMAVLMVESAGNPLALSPKRARGLWQLMPATARDYGLEVNQRRDERVHTGKATLAAARLLKDLYRDFHNWPLALAAYNAGRQAVASAVKRAASDDFWELSARGMLPRETRDYVPAVLSLMQSVNPAN